MVDATFSETPVSEQVSDGSTITVPTDEVWQVTISAGAVAVSDNSSDSIECLINTLSIASSESNSNSDDTYGNGTANAETTFPFETVLVGDDDIEASGGALQISGFVVNDTYSP
jgi:hypothetical protein